MTTTVGRVDFTARIDGKRTPRDAENIGRKAGAASSEGYDEEWSKGFRETLNKSARQSFDRWKAAGKKDGTIYSDYLTKEHRNYIKTAKADFAKLKFEPGFLDDFSKKYRDAGLAAGELQESIVELRRENEITEAQFNAAKKQVDEWADSQRKAAIASNDHRDSMNELRTDIDKKKRAVDELNETMKESESTTRRVRKEIDETTVATDRNTVSVGKNTTSLKKNSASWKNLSHNTRQVILIASAIAAGFEQISSLTSGASAALGGLIGVLGSGIAGAGVLGATALAGFAWQAILAVNAAKLMKEEFPAAQAGMTALATAAKNDARAFARAWGPALTNFTNTLAGLWRDDRIGEQLGKSMASITLAFTSVLKSPAYQSFQTAMETTIPTALASIGKGAASLTEGLLNIFGAAGPALVKFGDSFASYFDDWKGRIQDLADSGQLAEMFEDMRVSLQKTLALLGSFGAALRSTFGPGVKYGQSMLDTLTDLSDRWNRWNKSIEGQKALENWFRNGEKIFNGLLDLAGDLGRMFANIVTDDSINRSLKFMDNLGGGLKLVEDMAIALGGLDVFGLIAEALNGLGQALAPLAQPMYELGLAINDVLSAGLSAVIDVIGDLAPLLEVIVKGVTSFLNSLDPGAIDFFTKAIIGVVAGVKLIKFGQAIAAFAGFGAAAKTAGAAATTFGSTAKSALGKAGLIGAAAAGVFFLSDAILDFGKKLSGVDDISRNAVASNKSLRDSFQEISDSQKYLFGTQDIKEWGGALDALSNDFARFIGLPGTAGAEAQQLATALNELDVPMAALAQNSLPQAQSQMKAWADETGATSQQILNMLDHMPEYKAQLEAVALANGQLANDQTLVELATGATATTMGGLSAAFMDNATQSDLASERIANLQQSILNLGNDTITTNSYARAFEASVDALSESLLNNGSTLNIAEAAGRANQAAVEDMAIATKEYANRVLEESGNLTEANGIISDGRQRLISMAEQLGMTADEAAAYADELGLIPPDVTTKTVLDGVNAALNTLADLTRTRTVTINTIMNGAGFEVGNRTVTPYATGGTVYGATRALIGEAGPEAVVPLNRPLSMVDPSVRWLSAIAQGKATTQTMASGAVAGGGGGIVFEAGSIVVQGAEDPRQTAFEVADVIADRIAG